MQIFPTIPGGTEIYMMDNPEKKLMFHMVEIAI
jgi:hypothetical protein